MTRAVAIAALASLSLLSSCTFTFLLSPGSGLSRRTESAVRAVIIRDEDTAESWLCVQFAAHQPPWLWLRPVESHEAIEMRRVMDTSVLPPPRALVAFDGFIGGSCDVTLRKRDRAVHCTCDSTEHAAMRSGALVTELASAEVTFTEVMSPSMQVAMLACAIAIDVGLVALIVAL